MRSNEYNPIKAFDYKMPSKMDVTVEIEGAHYDLQIVNHPYRTTRQQFKDQLIELAGPIDFSNMECSYFNGKYRHVISLDVNANNELIPSYHRPTKIELKSTIKKNNPGTNLSYKWKSFSKEFKDHFENITRKQRYELQHKYSQPNYRNSNKYISISVGFSEEMYWESSYLTQQQREDYLKEFAFIEYQENKFWIQLQKGTVHSMAQSLLVKQHFWWTCAEEFFIKLVDASKDRKFDGHPSYVLSFFHHIKSKITFLVEGNSDPALNPLGYLNQSASVYEKSHALPGVYHKIFEVIDRKIVEMHRHILQQALRELNAKTRTTLIPYVKKYFTDLLAGADKECAPSIAEKVYRFVNKNYLSCENVTCVFEHVIYTDWENPLAIRNKQVIFKHEAPEIRYLKHMLECVMKRANFTSIKDKKFYYSFTDIGITSQEDVKEYVGKILTENNIDPRKIQEMLISLIRIGQAYALENINRAKEQALAYFQEYKAHFSSLTFEESKSLLALFTQLSWHPLEVEAGEEKYSLDHSLRYLRASSGLVSSLFKDEPENYHDSTTVFRVIRAALLEQIKSEESLTNIFSYIAHIQQSDNVKRFLKELIIIQRFYYGANNFHEFEDRILNLRNDLDKMTRADLYYLQFVLRNELVDPVFAGPDAESLNQLLTALHYLDEETFYVFKEKRNLSTRDALLRDITSLQSLPNQEGDEKYDDWTFIDSKNNYQQKDVESEFSPTALPLLATNEVLFNANTPDEEPTVAMKYISGLPDMDDNVKKIVKQLLEHGKKFTSNKIKLFITSEITDVLLELPNLSQGDLEQLKMVLNISAFSKTPWKIALRNELHYLSINLFKKEEKSFLGFLNGTSAKQLIEAEINQILKSLQKESKEKVAELDELNREKNLPHSESNSGKFAAVESNDEARNSETISVIETIKLEKEKKVAENDVNTVTGNAFTTFKNPLSSLLPGPTPTVYPTTSMTTTSSTASHSIGAAAIEPEHIASAKMKKYIDYIVTDQDVKSALRELVTCSENFSKNKDKNALLHVIQDTVQKKIVELSPESLTQFCTSLENLKSDKDLNKLPLKYLSNKIFPKKGKGFLGNEINVGSSSWEKIDDYIIQAQFNHKLNTFMKESGFNEISKDIIRQLVDIGWNVQLLPELKGKQALETLQNWVNQNEFDLREVEFADRVSSNITKVMCQPDFKNTFFAYLWLPGISNEIDKKIMGPCLSVSLKLIAADEVTPGKEKNEAEASSSLAVVTMFATSTSSTASNSGKARQPSEKRKPRPGSNHDGDENL